jgi:capsular polysaccharide biosynthesis protein
MIARGWLVIVCATVLSAAAAVAAAEAMQDPMYAADTRSFAIVPGDAQTHAAYEGNRGAAVRMSTYQQLATSTIVTQRTIDDLGLRETPQELAERITTRTVPGDLSRFAYPLSVLLELQVTGSDPGSTVDVANAVTRNLIAASQEVEWHDTESGPALVLVDEAKSAHEAGESWTYHAAVGAALGLALSVLAVLASGAARDRIFNRDQIEGVATDLAGAGRTEASR